MKTVAEVSRLTGISVRTLHHYDFIGLLKPTAVTEAGYRLYDEIALQRLQTILLFRELQFPLKEIKTILDHPEYDPANALRQQICLLELQRDRLNTIIQYAREIEQKGLKHMDFKAFDKTEQNRYAQEVKSRWGETAAYQEYETRGSHSGGDALMALFADLGQLKDLPPDAPQVQTAVKAIQDHITAHYYTCTKEIFAGLGQMYVQDDRFRANIDSAGGAGTAAFSANAISVYCNA